MMVEAIDSVIKLKLSIRTNVFVTKMKIKYINIKFKMKYLYNHAAYPVIYESSHFTHMCKNTGMTASFH